MTFIFQVVFFWAKSNRNLENVCYFLSALLLKNLIDNIRKWKRRYRVNWFLSQPVYSSRNIAKKIFVAGYMSYLITYHIYILLLSICQGMVDCLWVCRIWFYIKGNVIDKIHVNILNIKFIVAFLGHKHLIYRNIIEKGSCMISDQLHCMPYWLLRLRRETTPKNFLV